MDYFIITWFSFPRQRLRYFRASHFFLQIDKDEWKTRCLSWGWNLFSLHDAYGWIVSMIESWAWSSVRKSFPQSSQLLRSHWTSHKLVYWSVRLELLIIHIHREESTQDTILESFEAKTTVILLFLQHNAQYQTDLTVTFHNRRQRLRGQGEEQNRQTEDELLWKVTCRTRDQRLMVQGRCIQEENKEYETVQIFTVIQHILSTNWKNALLYAYGRTIKFCGWVCVLSTRCSVYRHRVKMESPSDFGDSTQSQLSLRGEIVIDETTRWTSDLNHDSSVRRQWCYRVTPSFVSWRKDRYVTVTFREVRLTIWDLDVSACGCRQWKCKWTYGTFTTVLQKVDAQILTNVQQDAYASRIDEQSIESAIFRTI